MAPAYGLLIVFFLGPWVRLAGRRPWPIRTIVRASWHRSPDRSPAEDSGGSDAPDARRTDARGVRGEFSKTNFRTDLLGTAAGFGRFLGGKLQNTKVHFPRLNRHLKRRISI